MTELKEKFLTQKTYFKDKYRQLITLIICSIGIIISVVGFGIKISSNQAVLKENVSTLNKLLEAKGKISFSYDKDLNRYYVYKEEKK